jgi:Xaa-Pro dipeptidase
MGPSADQLLHRQRRLLDELDRFGLDALLLNAGPSLTYLTGLDVHLNERPVAAIFRPDGVPTLVVPSLELGRLEKLAFEARTHSYGEDPSSWARTFRHASDEARLDYRRIGVEPQRFRVLELRLFEAAAPRAAYLDGGEVLSALRRCKDAGEIACIREAVRVAEGALRRTMATVRPGITETALASALTAQLLIGGSAAALPFSPIVAFGASTADPHAVPSHRALEANDLILIDWGANVGGYFSDLTRMFSYGPPAGELLEIVELAAAANDAARKAAAPGVRAADVDEAARAVIEQAGYGPRFIHRTGHGLGLETHEEPYIRSGNGESLESGMAFTIEPGIYLPGIGGARIEDDIVITSEGHEALSSLGRGLVDLTHMDVSSKK